VKLYVGGIRPTFFTFLRFFQISKNTSRERGGRARFGYLSRGRRVPSDAAGHSETVFHCAITYDSALGA